MKIANPLSEQSFKKTPSYCMYYCVSTVDTYLSICVGLMTANIKVYKITRYGLPNLIIYTIVIICA